MSEFNLIPSSYPRRTMLKRWIVGFIVFYTCTVAGLVAGHRSLTDYIDTTQAEISQLDKDAQGILARKSQLRELHDQRNKLKYHLAVLSGLIDGPRVQQLFYAIDRAINEDIWFVDWSFVRAGELVKVQPQRVSNGYFIILAKDSATDEQQAWKIQTHMEITARAVNHSALAKFVRQLGTQDGVEQVRIVSTRTQNQQNIQVIDFKLAVILDNSKETE